MNNKTPLFLTFYFLFSAVLFCKELGETLRFGASHYALENTIILEFDRCDDEYEIILNKPIQNAFKYNIVEKNIETGIIKDFIKSELELVNNPQNFLIPVSKNSKQEKPNNSCITAKENTRFVQYSKKESLVALNSRKSIHVKAGLNSLFDAANNSQLGEQKCNVKNLYNLSSILKKQSFQLQNGLFLKENMPTILA
ncbi:hypothetical protein J1D01_04910 [Seonamhaeicola sp. NFXS20]|uniref:hypothetical protein n=1 Tax=Seonamhaeicola sp. NFXS20 TaxID=2816959 RepID=UPI003B8C5DAD